MGIELKANSQISHKSFVNIYHRLNTFSTALHSLPKTKCKFVDILLNFRQFSGAFVLYVSSGTICFFASLPPQLFCCSSLFSTIFSYKFRCILFASFRSKNIKNTLFPELNYKFIFLWRNVHRNSAEQTLKHKSFLKMFRALWRFSSPLLINIFRFSIFSRYFSVYPANILFEKIGDDKKLSVLS